jgi:rubrerythrin
MWILDLIIGKEKQCTICSHIFDETESHDLCPICEFDPDYSEDLL